MTDDEAAEAIRDTLISINCDANLEAANVVDGLYTVASALRSIAKAIRESGEKPPFDCDGE